MARRRGYAGRDVATVRARTRLRQMAMVALVTCLITPVFNLLTSEASLTVRAPGAVRRRLHHVPRGRLPPVPPGRLPAPLVPAARLLDGSGDQQRDRGRAVPGRSGHRPGGDDRSSPAASSRASPSPPLLRPAVLRGARGRDAVRPADEPHDRRQRPALLRGRASTTGRRPRSASSSSSTSRARRTLAERLGSARYFELLRRFVDDLTDPIVASRGEIYQYAGDEVVVTWPLAEGVRAANCVRCFFLSRDAVAREAERYTRDFGTVPRFRAGLHGGHGHRRRARRPAPADRLRRRHPQHRGAARGVRQADGLDLVISGPLLRRLTLPSGVTATPCGDLEIRGKEARVTAFSVTGAPATRDARASRPSRRTRDTA